MSRSAAFRQLLSMLPLRSILPAGIASLGASVSGMLLMGASAWLITSAAFHPPVYTLAAGITLVRACGLGRAVFRYLERLLSHRAVFSMLTEIRLSLYRRTADRFPMRAGRAKEGEMLHDLGTGCDILRDFYLRALAPPLYSFLLTLPVCFALWPLVGADALLLLACWGLCPCLSFFLAESAERAGHASEAAYRDSLLEWQGGRRELAAAGKTDIAEARMDREAGRLKELWQRGRRRENLCRALAALMGGGTLFLLFRELFSRASEGVLTGIELAVWLLLMLSLLESYTPLAAAAKEGSRAVSAAKRILSEEAGERAAPEQRTSNGTAGRDENDLRAEDICFSYFPSVPVLEHLDLSLPKGSHTALLGESGAGKTTLLHLLLGLWEPDEGRVLFRGKDIREYSREELAASLSAAADINYIFGMTVRENFRMLYPEIDDGRIWESLRICQLEELIRPLPEQLDTYMGEDGENLSGGERKRLQLALALAGEAPVLILDEPTANLDRETARNLMKAILSHRRGRTLLIITHDLPLAGEMERVRDLNGTFRLDNTGISL